MNPQIRKLMAAMAALLLSLFVAATYIQYWRQPDLVADQRNARPIYESWKRDRGPIIAAGQEIAASKKDEDDSQFQRVYAHGREYAAITGYAAMRLHLYSGLEKAASSELDGTSSSLWTQRVQDLLTGSEPRGGALALSIDPKVQQATYDAMSGKTGAAVAFDPTTGEIKAMVSMPTYDPNHVVQPDAAKAREFLKSLQDDPTRPLTNRAIAGDRYPPGSVFKLVTAATALSQGKLTPDTKVDAPDKLPFPGTNFVMSNYRDEVCGDRHPTFTQALVDSCNTPFGKLGVELGWDAISEQAQKFGFDQDFSIPMGVTRSVFPQTESDAQLAQSAIGQFNVQVTPMQVAMVSGAIANKGKLMTPFLIESTLNRDLVVQSTTEPRVLSEALSPEVAEQLKNMMIEVVKSGTGKNAAIRGVQVAGKTGTAQTGRGGSHAWFTGFAPADNPKIVVAVVVESTNGEYLSGGVDAAPVARQIMKAGL